MKRRREIALMADFKRLRRNLPLPPTAAAGQGIIRWLY
jgi:hypothetical protein